MRKTAEIKSFYHTLNFRNYNYKSQVKDDTAIKYEKKKPVFSPENWLYCYAYLTFYHRKISSGRTLFFVFRYCNITIL